MEPDFSMLGVGSILQLIPLNPPAQAWCDEHLPEDCPRLGMTYCIEHRFVGAIVEGIYEAGFKIRRGV